MISIIAKSSYAFRNPNKDADVLISGIGDSNRPRLEDAMYTCKAAPNEIQQAPDWIKGDPTAKLPGGEIKRTNAMHWANAQKDWAAGKGFGILEVQPVATVPVAAKAGQQPVKFVPKTKEELAVMTKDELVAYAEEEHDLELDGKEKKDDLVDAIHAEEQKKAE